MVSSRKDGVDEVAPEKSQHEGSPEGGSHGSDQNKSSEIHAPQSDKDGGTPLNVQKKLPAESNTSQSQRSDHQGSVSSVKSEKASSYITSDIVLASPTEGTSPTIMREKVSEDGYNWRKYGQKLVRANEFVRSYYKCTHPNCRVKKQLDCTHSGHITDTIYFGKHEHPRSPNVPLAVGVVVSIIEERQDDSSSSVAKGNKDT